MLYSIAQRLHSYKILAKRMNNCDKLCLQWNDFKENIGTSFADLRTDRDLTDVTLACEDGKQVEAHKVILAASSPFFMRLLKKNKHPHPLIYMRGFKSDDLMAIVDFLYRGETNVFQENLDSFLAFAEELQLKGLTGTSGNVEGQERVALPIHKENSVKQNSTLNSLIESPNLTKEFNEAKNSNTTVALNSDFEDLDSQIRSMITKSDVQVENRRGKMATCNVCGKQGPYNSMPRHVEALHITGVSHSCDTCGNVFRSRHALSRHKCSNSQSFYSQEQT